MEVSGKKPVMPQERVPSKGSFEGISITCQPCSSEGDELEAEGFCQNCQEYLCKTCVRYHRKATLSKHHMILDKEKMPQSIGLQKPKQICTETCEKHTLEVIKFFCRDHDTVGCGNCMVLEHKVCEVDFIPDIAEEFANGEEYINLHSKLGGLQVNVMSMKEVVKMGKQASAEMNTVAINKIKTFRKEAESYLDKMERLMIAESDRLNKRNEQVIKNTEENLKSFESELDQIHDRLTTRTKETADLFVKAKQACSRLSELEKGIARETSCTLSKYEFQRKRELEAIISGSSPLGNLNPRTSQIYLPKGRNIVDFEPVFAGEIIVRSPSDKTNIRISSMTAASSNTLLCVDRNNESVKVVDTENRCLCSQIKLTSGPWDITSVSNNQVAVTIPDFQKIQFLFLKDKKLSSSREMKVDGKCRGIAYHQDTLIVSFVEVAKLQILNLDGSVLRTFMTHPESNTSLGWPGCIDVGADGNCFFVSDLEKNCVLKMTFDWNLLATYRGNNLVSPRAITVCKDKSVLVCAERYNMLHLMSPECRGIKILLTEKDGLKCPQSVYYNDTTSTLYLSNTDNRFAASDTANTILVYCQA